MKRQTVWLLRLLAWTCVGAVAVLIWQLSGETAAESSSTSGGLIHQLLLWLDPTFSALSPAERLARIEVWQDAVRRMAHFGIYGVLGSGLFAAFTVHFWDGWVRVLATLSSGVLYAVTDELHQRLVCGRAFEISDIVTDTLGVAAAIAVLCGVDALAVRYGRRHSRKEHERS